MDRIVEPAALLDAGRSHCSKFDVTNVAGTVCENDAESVNLQSKFEESTKL